MTFGDKHRDCGFYTRHGDKSPPSCRVLIVCISADLAVPGNNAITVSERRPHRSSVAEISGGASEGRQAKVPLMVPFASGAVSNVPPSQIANVGAQDYEEG